MQPLLQWKSNAYYIYWECVFSLRYSAWNAHAPYCHLWPARLCHIFQRYLINGKFFQKTVIEPKMCVLIFSTTFVWNIFHSKKNWVRYDQNVCWFSCDVPLIEFPGQIFAKYSCNKEAQGDAVGWGTALQTGRSPVRFPMVSLEFFIDIILPAALWPWGWLSL